MISEAWSRLPSFCRALSKVTNMTGFPDTLCLVCALSSHNVTGHGALLLRQPLPARWGFGSGTLQSGGYAGITEELLGKEEVTAGVKLGWMWDERG